MSMWCCHLCVRKWAYFTCVAEQMSGANAFLLQQILAANVLFLKSEIFCVLINFQAVSQTRPASTIWSANSKIPKIVACSLFYVGCGILRQVSFYYGTWYLHLEFSSTYLIRNFTEREIVEWTKCAKKELTEMMLSLATEWCCTPGKGDVVVHLSQYSISQLPLPLTVLARANNSSNPPIVGRHKLTLHRLSEF